MRRFQVSWLNAVDLAKREASACARPIIRTHRHQIRFTLPKYKSTNQTIGRRAREQEQGGDRWWIILLMALPLDLWIFCDRNPSLIDWRAVAPWWIADYCRTRV